MKAGSDNFREASVLDLIKILKNLGKELVIYEPTWKEKTFNGIEINNNLNDFLSESTLIVANRKDLILNGIHKKKIFTRDIFNIT